jgi:hypothetical protein
MSRGIRAEMSMVVTRWSRGEVGEAVRIANQIGLPEFHFILPQPTPETALEGSDLSPREWNVVADEVRELARCSPTLIGLDYGTFAPHPRPSCNTMAMRQLYVDARGRVPFCCQLSRYGSGEEAILGDLTREPLSQVLSRAAAAYEEFSDETDTLYQLGLRDDLDDYPCMSCARRHGQTAFLAAFPDHPWAALAARPA